MTARVAGAALVITAAILAWAIRGAIRVDDLGPAASLDLPPLDARGAARPTPPTGYPIARVLAAVARDPFHPERRRPGARFRLPSDHAAEMRHLSVPGTEPAVRVIGTAVATSGKGFALCTWQGGPPRIVRVGERAGDWTLKAVTPGAAEFTTPSGATIVVRVPKAGEGS